VHTVNPIKKEKLKRKKEHQHPNAFLFDPSNQSVCRYFLILNF